MSFTSAIEKNSTTIENVENDPLVIENDPIQYLMDLELKAQGAGKMLILDFTAKWCGPCKKIAPLLEKLHREKGTENIYFLKVDIDEQEELAQMFEISSIPFLTRKLPNTLTYEPFKMNKTEENLRRFFELTPIIPPQQATQENHQLQYKHPTDLPPPV